LDLAYELIEWFLAGSSLPLTLTVFIPVATPNHSVVRALLEGIARTVKTNKMSTQHPVQHFPSLKTMESKPAAHVFGLALTAANWKCICHENAQHAMESVPQMVVESLNMVHEDGMAHNGI